MNYKLLLNTVLHLKPTQVVHQVKNRLIKTKYREMECPSYGIRAPKWLVEPIPRQKCTDGDRFTFINIPSEFTGWNDACRGMLWAYNQNYFDFINEGLETGVRGREYGVYWIDKFIAELPFNKVGLDPYPIALRGINWVKFFGRYPDTMTRERVDSLYSQYKLLQRKLEYHLLGNHLLEDFYSLYIMSLLFGDVGYHKWVTTKLLKELEEEILQDGGHYEQSVMYHCILLDRLLDCINLAKGAGVESLETSVKGLESYATRMLGWLDAMCFEDGSFPLFNDAAMGIAPMPNDIFDYAKRLGLAWDKAKLGDSGYRRLLASGKSQESSVLEATVDVGNITATYQPGHTHADALNYELHIDGKPVVVDTGISTYNKTARRQYERSGVAHNVVVKEGASTNSSASCYEVWGGFRVGRRCKTAILKDTATEVTALHDGYGKPCTRTWKIENGALVVEDQYEGKAVSMIHLEEGVAPERVKVMGATSIEVEDGQYSTEYNRFHTGKVMKIHFSGSCRYTIQ